MFRNRATVVVGVVRKRRRRRFTVASLYLAAALGVALLVLTRMVPALAGLEDRPRQRPSPAPGWYVAIAAASNWARENTTFGLAAVLAVTAAGFILPLCLPATRPLIWLLALAVFAVDIAIAAGSYWHAISALLRQAGGGL